VDARPHVARAIAHLAIHTYREYVREPLTPGAGAVAVAGAVAAGKAASLPHPG